MVEQGPDGDYPKIDKTSYVHGSAVVIGRVIIGKRVFIGPGAIIRADEAESSIIIKDNCNIQDRVVIHVLENSSVYIEENTSLTHGCIIHGPCKIGKNCFIGFGSVVFNAELGKGVFIKQLSCVEDVKIPSGMLVESGKSVNNNNDVKKLRLIDKQLREFAKKVIEVNMELAGKYMKTGKTT